jgi:hypothetical protein
LIALEPAQRPQLDPAQWVNRRRAVLGFSQAWRLYLVARSPLHCCLP